MGAIGNKRHTYNIKEEPILLNGVHNILEEAKQKDLIVNNQVNIEEIIKQQYPQILLEFRPLASEISGELIKEKDTWHMIINSKHSKTRQRFTMGHELGHYVYHRRETSQFIDTLFYRQNELKSSIEYMADEFAALLLMPEDLIKSCFSKGVNNVGVLASTFGVSNEAITYRLQQLNYKISY